MLSMYLYIMEITAGSKLVAKKLKLIGVYMNTTVNNDTFLLSDYSKLNIKNNLAVMHRPITETRSENFDFFE